MVDNASQDGVVEMLQPGVPGNLPGGEPGQRRVYPPDEPGAAPGRRPLPACSLTRIRWCCQEPSIAWWPSWTSTRKRASAVPRCLIVTWSLQKPCRRGEPRPWAVLTYFLGLSALFPRSRLFSQYLVTYLDEDQINAVDGVAGSCMLLRRRLDRADRLPGRALFCLPGGRRYLFSRPAGGLEGVLYAQPPRSSTMAAWAARASSLTARFTNGIDLISTTIACTWQKIISFCSTGFITWRWALSCFGRWE